MQVRNGHLAVAPHVEDQAVAALADALEFHDLLGDEDEVVDDAAVIPPWLLTISSALVMCSFETTRTWTGAWGAMS